MKAGGGVMAKAAAMKAEESAAISIRQLKYPSSSSIMKEMKAVSHHHGNKC
jgi:hypothetical protein